MRAVLVSVVIVVAAAACTQPTPQQQAAEIATDICTCAQPGVAACVTNVEQSFGAMGPSQACLDCVFADQHACAAMVLDCLPTCVPGAVSGGV